MKPVDKYCEKCESKTPHIPGGDPLKMFCMNCVSHPTIRKTLQEKITVDVIVDGYSSLVKVSEKMTFKQLALKAYKQIKSSFPEFKPRNVNDCLFEVGHNQSERPLEISNVLQYMKHGDYLVIHRKAYHK
jgi:hypothetical protein